MRIPDSAIHAVSKARSLLDSLASVLGLLIRGYLTQVFFLSGLTKIRDWDTTLALFQDEYHVPVIAPALAAVLGTAGELALPVFLFIGLGTRFAAFGLSVLNVMAVISYWHVLKDAAPALAQHMYWGALLLVVLLHGPGVIALDRFVWNRWGNSQSTN